VITASPSSWSRLGCILLAASMPMLLGSAAASAQPATNTAPAVRLGSPDDADVQSSGTSGESATALAKKLQNPIGDLISIPFQNNTNFRFGPHKGTQDVLNIQPVIPIHVTPDWNIITRTILPLIWQPSLQPANTVPFGTGPITFSAFLSPRNAVDGWVWGVGPVVQIPTISNKSLGSNVWGAGPSAVIVKLAGPWVAGGLVNNVFSFGGTTGQGGTKYNTLTFQPFVNYNFGGGWFVGTAPIVTANWLASGNKWTLPVGAQTGRLIKIADKLPVNLLVGAYYNALRPEFGSTWQLRTQVAVIF
jgi:hypothetical protein